MKVIASFTQSLVKPGPLFLELSDSCSLIARVADLFLSRKKEDHYRSLRPSNPLISRSKELFPYLSKNGKYENNFSLVKKDADKLIVFLHGLHNSPLAWSNYLQEIWKKNPRISCFVPEIQNRADCRLQEAALPILEFLQAYIRSNPDHPIDLVGHSRGAVIAGHVMRNLKGKNVRLISIAGPHGGSKFMTATYLLGLHKSFKVRKEVVEESFYLNDFLVSEVGKWQEDSREKIFFAGADDVRVFPSNTCFPNLPSSTYFLVANESHSGIIDGLEPEILPLLL